MMEEGSPVATVHAVLITDVIVNGVSVNVRQLRLALVWRGENISKTTGEENNRKNEKI